MPLYERPVWAEDAINNPANVGDPDLDPYAPFDPENEDLAVKRLSSLYEPEDTKKQVEVYAEGISNAYEAAQSYADNEELINYGTAPRVRSTFKIGDVASFLFGDELAGIGIKMDNNQMRWSAEIAKDQWANHPLRTSLAFASWLVPFGLGKAAKVSRTGKLAKITPEHLVAANKVDSVDTFLKMDSEAQTIMKNLYHHDSYYQELLAKANAYPDDLTMMERVKLHFHNNWANEYAKISDESSSAAHNIKFRQRMHETLKDEVVDPFLGEIPDELIDGSEAFSLFVIGKGSIDDIAEAARPWAQSYRDAAIETQKYLDEIGFLSPGTIERIGEAYHPLIRLEYEASRPLRGVTERQVVMKGNKPVEVTVPKLTSESLLQRQTTLDEFAELIRDGSVVTDPRKVTMQGLAHQKMLGMTFEHVRDTFMHPHFSATAAEIAERGGNFKDWVKITEVPESERILRMMRKRPIDAGGPRPDLANADRYIRRDAWEQLAGRNGLAGQAREATAFLQSSVRMYKFAKTALNAYTQAQNIMGNLAFLSQAGFRLFTGPNKVQNWKTLRGGMTNVNEHFRVITGKTKKANYKPMTIHGRKWSAKEIREELNSAEVRDLVEEAGFLKAEGSNGEVMQYLIDKSENASDFLGNAMKSGRNELDRWKRYYNVGDGGPKFAYYMDLRSRGFSRFAALQETGRRLPIYHGISAGPRVPGLGIKVGPAALRKWMFPWMSFPAEAMRITKNNMMDYPMRMAAWLHAPQIVQSMVYTGSHAFGIGEPMSYADYEGARKGLPVWGQNQSTVMLPLRDRNNDLRAMLINQLPHFTFMPGTTAAEAAISDKIPMVSPNDIAPILSGMLGLFTGKGTYGQPIQYTSKADAVQKFIANAVGFFTPPMVQKYFFNITSPRSGFNLYKAQQDLGMVVNPQTGKPGSWFADLIVNNFIMKNYASSGEQEHYNRELEKNRTVDRVRKELTRRYTASVRSGSTEEASKYLLDIYQTFIKEYTPGPVAQQKWAEFLARHRRLIMMHPQLRRYSEEEILRFIFEANQNQTGIRNIGLKNSIDVFKKELMMRHAAPSG